MCVAGICSSLAGSITSTSVLAALQSRRGGRQQLIDVGMVALDLLAKEVAVRPECHLCAGVVVNISCVCTAGVRKQGPVTGSMR